MQTSYVPTSGSYSNNSQYSGPTGLAPQPLPTSRTYVRAPKSQHRGIMAAVKDSMNRATDKAQRSWNEATDERFRRYFGFDFTEQLYGEFWGEVWTGGVLAPCSVYVSTNYLCVLFKSRNSVTKDKIHIKATIALRDISHIQRAFCLPSTAGAPVIQPINDPNVKSDSVMIYTSDGNLHQFCKFYNYDSLMHTLDYNWRTIKSGRLPSGSATPYPQSAAGIPYQTTVVKTSYQGLNMPFNNATAHPTYGYQRLPKDRKAERFEMKAAEWERRGNMQKAQKNREKALRYRQRTQPGYVAPVRSQTYYIERANLFDTKARQYQEWGMQSNATRYQQRSNRLRNKHGLPASTSTTTTYVAGNPTLVKTNY